MKTLAAIGTLILVTLFLGFLACRNSKRGDKVTTIRNTRHWGLK
jgi:hypothetical protein